MAVAFLADTSAYSRFLQSDTNFAKYFSRKTPMIYFPYITIAEIRAGAKNGNRMRENEAALSIILNQPNTEVLMPTLRTTDLYSDIFVALRRAGRPIGANDIWIAALALEHDLPLLTADADFKHIAGLKLL